MKTKQGAKDIIDLAKRYGFKLIRQRKHLVFCNEHGQKLVTSKSTSDHRSIKNIEATIKKLISNHDTDHSS